eukprot:s452_g5.t2
MYGAYGAGYGPGYGQGYSQGYGQAGYAAPAYQAGYGGHARPAMPPRPLPGMDPATGIVWPGGQRPSGPIVKAGNLAKDITVPTLKQALTKWGVDGIKEVLLTESRFGQVALFLFKEVEKAQLMMMAQGVEVSGRPLMLEFLPAPSNAKAAEKKPAKEAKIVTEIMKVSGLPKKMEKSELVTHLRSHGVLGISQVVLEKHNTALVRFNEERDVPKAIDKANNTTFKEKKLTLEPFPGHWDTLFPDGEPMDYRPPEESQGSSRGSRRETRKEDRIPPRPGYAAAEQDRWDEQRDSRPGAFNGYGQPVSGHHGTPPPSQGSHYGHAAEQGQWVRHEAYGPSHHRDHGGYGKGSRGGYGSYDRGPY